jgi:hypothetical protein
MLEFNVDPSTQLVTIDHPNPTPSVLWDRAVQQAVINRAPGPTIASRAYAMMHTAMFDAWSAYDADASSTQSGDQYQRPQSENTFSNKLEAVSFAAYRVLADLFPSELAIFDDVMDHKLGIDFDQSNTTTDPTIAAGIGNLAAAALLAVRHFDGANQLNDYADTTGYTPLNSLEHRVDISAWTPERVPIDAVSNEAANRIQKHLTPHWGRVTPFALESSDSFRPEAPQPFFTDACVGSTLNFQDKTITLPDANVVPVTRDLIGTVINPEFIHQATQVIEFSKNLTDTQKLIAEFWENGKGTSFPPGTWMTFGQCISARDHHTLDEDIKLFFPLAMAVADTGIATWEAKTFYDYARPVRVIRDLGALGLIGELGVDQLTGETGYVIDATVPAQGVKTILAENFLTYQTPGGDPSPPFAEYTSGHSGFSAAAAEVLRLFTGSDEFGASVTFQPGESRFEPHTTPASPITLAWDTFSAAADQAGISRLYGGIHFTESNVNGAKLGRQVGKTAFERAQSFIHGRPSNDTPAPEPIVASPSVKFEFNVTSSMNRYRAASGDTTVDEVSPRWENSSWTPSVRPVNRLNQKVINVTTDNRLPEMLRSGNSITNERIGINLLQNKAPAAVNSLILTKVTDQDARDRTPSRQSAVRDEGITTRLALADYLSKYSTLPTKLDTLNEGEDHPKDVKLLKDDDLNDLNDLNDSRT